jgi:hypothetical protein
MFVSNSDSPSPFMFLVDGAGTLEVCTLAEYARMPQEELRAYDARLNPVRAQMLAAARRLRS